MFLSTQLQLSMPVQQPLLLTHAQLPICQTDLDEAAVPPGPEGLHLPSHLVLTADDGPFLVRQEPLRERVVNVHYNRLIPVHLLFEQLLLLLELVHLFQPSRIPLISPDKFPYIVLRNMVGSIRTT